MRTRFGAPPFVEPRYRHMLARSFPAPGRLSQAWCLAVVACLASGHSRAGQLEDLSSYTGAELYQEYCASCHGEQAHGDGPVASSLKVQVPDLTRISARQGGTFPVDRVRSLIDGRIPMPPHGTRTMPVWGWAFRATSTSTDPQAEYRTQALIGLLVDYLRSIQQK
jgi:mono/diheme cytochrome c family protein